MKKYILLFIGLLMIANNALAQSAYDEKGFLMRPEALTVKEAYILLSQKNASDNTLLFIGFEKGIQEGVLTQRLRKEIKNKEKVITCVTRPLIVYENFIFRTYESGILGGDTPYGQALVSVINVQCFNE